MATSTRKFDPYHQWLGIPAHEQPPDHYRLLRIAPFESDPEVIENAYNREMADLKAQEHGEHVDLVEQLSREVIAARRCLLDSEEKASYDSELRKKLDVDNEGGDLAAELEQRVAVDRAVQQATAEMTVELKRLRAEAQRVEERDRRASTLVKSLRSELARVQPQSQATSAESGHTTVSQVERELTIGPQQQAEAVANQILKVIVRGAVSGGAVLLILIAAVLAVNVVGDKEETNADNRDATEVVNSIGMRMRRIPAGEFQMGSSNGRTGSDERPVHRVRISKPFLLGVFPVTQEEYARVMDGATPSHFKGDVRRPVERVSWYDAVRFCNRLSELEEKTPYYRVAGNQVEILGGGGYRLPTEAEWEYACRAGSTGRWCFGDDEAELGRFAWYSENSGRTTRPVGQKEPNDWGLYDMHGNVWEWCQDRYDRDYYADSPSTDPTGPISGSFRVDRGGGWDDSPQYCRSANRLRDSPDDRISDLGFRVARSSVSK